MAKTNPETEEVKDDRVEVFIPKGQANEDPNLFVSVNGKNYLLPRGKNFTRVQLREKVQRYAYGNCQHSGQDRDPF